MTLLTRNGSPLVLSDSLDGLIPDLRTGDIISDEANPAAWPHVVVASSPVPGLQVLRLESTEPKALGGSGS